MMNDIALNEAPLTRRYASTSPQWGEVDGAIAASGEGPLARHVRKNPMTTKIHQPVPAPLDADALARWAAAPVTIVSDVTRGAVLLDAGLRPLRPLELGRRMVGRAVTAWCERSDLGAAIHAIDIAQAGDVVVIDAERDVLTAYVGELLCGHARRKRIAGLVIDGAARDIDTIASWPDFPVYVRGSTARGPLSKERGAVNGRIVCGGVVVEPGDVILGDNDGLAVVPAGQSAALLPVVEAQVRAEQAWAAELATGRALADVFAADGAA